MIHFGEPTAVKNELNFYSFTFLKEKQMWKPFRLNTGKLLTGDTVWGRLKSRLLCRCSHLLPDWRLSLASAGGGSPVECCRLPPAGAQRSWLSSPSPPPPSHNPLTWSPQETAAPSSHLRKKMWKTDLSRNNQFICEAKYGSLLCDVESQTFDVSKSWKVDSDA